MSVKETFDFFRATFTNILVIKINYKQISFNTPLTLKGPGGGGGGGIILWIFFSAPQAFMTFFFQVLRNFWRYFLKNRAYGSKVTQHYVIDRRLKI